MVSVPAQAPKSLVNTEAPRFVRSDLDEETIDLAVYRGKVVLLAFWATWCAPCRIEMPHFIDWQNKYGAEGLEIIGVAMEDDPAPVTVLTRKQRVNYPILMGDAPLAKAYGGVLGLPVTILIDRNGKIAARYEGRTGLTTMEREVQTLLRAPGQ